MPLISYFCPVSILLSRKKPKTFVPIFNRIIRCTMLLTMLGSGFLPDHPVVCFMTLPSETDLLSDNYNHINNVISNTYHIIIVWIGFQRILHALQIVEARHILLENLRNRNSQLENSDASQKEDTEVNDTQGESSSSQEKVLLQAKNAANDQIKIEQDDTSGVSSKVQKQLETEEDILFSDLEECDNDLPIRSQENIVKISSPRSSNEWVRLNASVYTQGGPGLQKVDQSFSRKRDSEGEDSNDWLTVDDFDSDS